MKRTAYTLIELLATMGIVAALISLSMPTLSRSREEARRTLCAANERGVGHAFYLYAWMCPIRRFPCHRSDDNRYQREHADLQQPGSRDAAVDHRSAIADGGFVGGGPRELCSAEAVVCPSTMDVADPMADSSVYYDFLSASNLSYAYQYQHSPNRRIIGMASEPMFPVFADANPYIKGGVTTGSLNNDRTGTGRGNSANHANREGQNVLSQDGHVDFEKGPDVGPPGRVTSGCERVSRGRDNCFTTHFANNAVDVGDLKPTVSGRRALRQGPSIWVTNPMLASSVKRLNGASRHRLDQPVFGFKVLVRRVSQPTASTMVLLMTASR